MGLLSGIHLCIRNEERLTSPIQHLSDLSAGKKKANVVECISLSLPSKNLPIIHIHIMATLSTLNAN